MKLKATKTVNLTEGSIPKKLLLFALPLMAGNILQQLYNIVDTIVVGKYLGEDALAAVAAVVAVPQFHSLELAGRGAGRGRRRAHCAVGELHRGADRGISPGVQNFAAKHLLNFYHESNRLSKKISTFTSMAHCKLN